jgi:Na+-transporting methylmalonyl-CoA/oxaloacetate decarboxylase gamma subunit
MADAGITLWIAGILLIGVLGFFLVLVTLMVRFIGWVFRSITGTPARHKRVSGPPANPSRRMVCPHPGCAHTNGPTALYCGRCGRPLRRTYDVDAYG